MFSTRCQSQEPYPDEDEYILSCPYCGSSEYLFNEHGAPNRFCGQCGQLIVLTTPKT